MTIYICETCGKFYNREVLTSCPFCHSIKQTSNITEVIRTIAREVVVKMDAEGFFDH